MAKDFAAMLQKGGFNPGGMNGFMLGDNAAAAQAVAETPDPMTTGVNPFRDIHDAGDRAMGVVANSMSHAMDHSDIFGAKPYVGFAKMREIGGIGMAA